jgi:cytochrome oxidase Cu insertion factor (SCO1/SenC/PrrC family)
MSTSSGTEAGKVPPPPPDAAGDQGPSPEAPPIDRAAALARGAPGIPAKFVYWALAVVLVVSIGGLLGEHLLSSTGLNPVATTVPGAVATTVPVATPSIPRPGRSIDSTLASFMGIIALAPHLAFPLTLTDQSGQPTSVPTQPPRVVVLTFFNAPCNDICPVEAAELEQADTDLGAAAADVEFVTVNTDPRALAQSADAPVLTKTALTALPNWHIVTGPLATLDSIWKAYGVSISVDKKTGLEAHNDVMTFIDTQGDLRYRATPYADESSTGAFSLPAATIARWGQGIAAYAAQLIRQ